MSNTTKELDELLEQVLEDERATEIHKFRELDENASADGCAIDVRIA